MSKSLSGAVVVAVCCFVDRDRRSALAFRICSRSAADDFGEDVSLFANESLVCGLRGVLFFTTSLFASGNMPVSAGLFASPLAATVLLTRGRSGVVVFTLDACGVGLSIALIVEALVGD